MRATASAIGVANFPPAPEIATRFNSNSDLTNAVLGVEPTLGRRCHLHRSLLCS